MAKTKTQSHKRNKSAAKGDSVLHNPNAYIKSMNSPRPIEDLLTEAASLLEQSQPDLALPLAEEALRRLEAERAQPQSVASTDRLLQLAAQGKATLPNALTVAADIQLAVGNVEAARTRFEKAVQIDPNGALVSADPLLWLAQLCEEGGKTSISYFDKGCDVLRSEIKVLQESGMDQDEEGEHVLDERRAKLAEALCGMAEVYMTDLSWEEDAEARCEAYVTEAVAICPDRLSAGTLQTLASIRISQQRTEDAREALRRSISLWKDIPAEVEDEARPDFATRISLARLLMEVQAEQEALEVLEWLVREDDESVECWYLGGWCQVLLAENQNVSSEDKQKLQEQALSWLTNCLRLYQLQSYEDDRLRDHAMELKLGLNQALGLEEADEDAWEDEEDDVADDQNIEVEFNGFDDSDGDVAMA
ncbi:hypothetical protein DV736_g4521, partial [Chaetothyriales sp. CBS 134916]